jgi:general stress protein 26
MEEIDVAEMSLQDLAEKMRHIDIAILTTRMAGGSLAGRPMSNNGDVDYDGVSYYFTYEDAHTVDDIERDANVGLAFQGSAKLFQSNKFYVFVEGKAELIRDRARFAEHWTPDLDKWFEHGINTPEIVLVKVTAARIKYWDGIEQGTVSL